MLDGPLKARDIRFMASDARDKLGRERKDVILSTLGTLLGGLIEVREFRWADDLFTQAFIEVPDLPLFMASFAWASDPQGNQWTFAVQSSLNDQVWASFDSISALGTIWFAENKATSPQDAGEQKYVGAAPALQLAKVVALLRRDRAKWLAVFAGSVLAIWGTWLYALPYLGLLLFAPLSYHAYYELAQAQSAIRSVQNEAKEGS